MKRCSKCGASNKSGAQFCHNCGTPLKESHVSRRSRKSNKRRIPKAAYWIIGLVVVLLAGGGFWLTKQSHASHSDVSSVTSKHKKITPKDVGALALVYAHLKYKDNSDWQQLFKEAKEGNCEVGKYANYNFGDYSVQADGSDLYVINGKGAVAVSKAANLEDAEVVFGDTHKQLGTTTVKKMIKAVPSGLENKEVTEISKHLTIRKKSEKESNDSESSEVDTHEETDESSQSSSSSSESSSQSEASSSSASADKTPLPGMKLLTIPVQFRGTWYSAKDTSDTMTITDHEIDGATLYSSDFWKNMNNTKLKKMKALGDKVLFGEVTADNIAYTPAKNYGSDALGRHYMVIDNHPALLEGSPMMGGRLYFRSEELADKYKDLNTSKLPDKKNIHTTSAMFQSSDDDDSDEDDE